MSDSFKRDINQMGIGGGLRAGASSEKPFLDAIVEDIIVNEEGGKTLRYEPDGSNLGQIRFREVPDDRGLQLSQLRTAFPLETTFLEYPLVGEQVTVYKTMGTLYYSRRVNITRKPTDSVWTELQTALSSMSSTFTNQDNVNLIKAGASVRRDNQTAQEIKRVTTNATTKFLRTFPGDIIVQGRFGNSMRLGTSLFKNPLEEKPQPNILLTAGQWVTPDEVSTEQLTKFSMYYENINMDKSSIWMVADQQVSFLPATATSSATKKAHLFSSSVKTSKYTGAQIFVNSDRVILNSKKNELSLFSNSEINLSAMKSITLDTEASVHLYGNKDISLTAGGIVSFTGKSIVMNATEDLSYKTSGNYSISGKKIFIGKYGDTSQPMVLGGNLAQWLNAVVTTLLTPGAILTPSGPATLRPDVAAKLLALKGLLGKPTAPGTAFFNSKANFTSETN